MSTVNDLSARLTGIHDGRWEERYHSVKQELDIAKDNLSKVHVELAEYRAMEHRIIQMAIDSGWTGDHNCSAEDAAKYFRTCVNILEREL